MDDKQWPWSLACDLTRWQDETGPVGGSSSEAGPPGAGVGHGLREFWRARAAAAAVWTCQNSPPTAPAPVPLREGWSTNLAAASPGVKSQAGTIGGHYSNPRTQSPWTS